MPRKKQNWTILLRTYLGKSIIGKECSENNMLIFHDRTKKYGRVET